MGNKPVKKLVVKEFIIDKDTVHQEIGEKYSYFYDPETGKYYRPKAGFEVIAIEDSELFEMIVRERFVEVPCSLAKKKSIDE